MKQYINPLLRAVSLAALLYVVYSQNKSISRLKTDNIILINERDSAQQELFIKDIDLGRYEHIMDRLDTELSPECNDKLHEISGETE
jgi:hypothetical protein